MREFYYKGNDFLLDGEKIQIHSGAIHYFRIHPDYWYDRLLKLRECGFNTVETYIAWNLHEKFEGKFDFSGWLDFGRFVDIASELGLLAIVRPGPYICAEWESGGLPYWLLKYKDMDIRCDDALYLEKLKRYLKKVFEIMRPRLIANGGNIIMTQIENEYGSYGNDRNYIAKLTEFYRNELPECVLFTADGACDKMFMGGTQSGVLTCANFGSKAKENMEYLKKNRPDQPYMCMEFWTGWFDHRGDKHHVRPTEEKIFEIEHFLKNGYSFNAYMFHGGTNFGFMNGANYIHDRDELQPTITSYDYDAFLTESGDRTEAYYALRELFSKYKKVPELTASESKKRAYSKVKFTKYAKLLDNFDSIGKTFDSKLPTYMEDADCPYGYMLYETVSDVSGNISFEDLADRAIVFDNGERVAICERGGFKIHTVPVSTYGSRITVLLENMGRINYGPRMLDRKGIKIRNENQLLFDWKNTTLPMDDLSGLKFVDLPEKISDAPAFFKGSFTVDEVADTYIRPEGFGKGFITVNGFNIGRFYNHDGPQMSFYIPAPLLKVGENEIIIFSSDGFSEPVATFTEKLEFSK